ncbi:MAG: flagellar motor stator protein MotA [Gammaproteobacteria bacterium]|nr:flagellar motor stator protein MotA [Gammaproteobacteria bacterium]MDH5652188.1 flagellar motor stator protein MotA [Gammaproteobacteria bacterium]
MKFILGIIVVMASVIGGYILSHGKLSALFQPFELLIIGGGAFGAFIIANPGKVIAKVFKGTFGLFVPSKYNKKMYMDLLTLMYLLFSKARKEGLMSLESDIEEPHLSDIFKTYPSIRDNHHVMDFITDYLRLMVGGNMNAFELENLMDVELDTHHHEAEQPANAMQVVADGLPAFGIVAAVMGVVITMGYISEPPEILGAHIGAALVGTFLGVLLAYGFAAPIANALKSKAEDESKFLQCAKVCIMSTLNGYTPQIAVEFGRKAIATDIRPGFMELEEHVKKAGKK